MELINKEEFVYKTCKFGMSKHKLSMFMYAVIMSRCEIRATFGIGIYEYSMPQNAYNNVEAMLFIHPKMVGKFEFTSNMKLNNPQNVHVNGSPTQS